MGCGLRLNPCHTHDCNADRCLDERNGRASGHRNSPCAESLLHGGRPSQRAVNLALVGLLTPRLGRVCLLTAGAKQKTPTFGNGEENHPAESHLVTAAGPSRNCTGVPCFVGRQALCDRPPTHVQYREVSLSVLARSVKNICQPRAHKKSASELRTVVLLRLRFRVG